MAGSTSRPAELSSAVFRPRWAVVVPRYPEVVSGPSPGPQVAARLQLSGRARRVEDRGHGRVAAGVRGALDSWLPAAGPGRLHYCSPARGRRPVHQGVERCGSLMGVRVGLLIPKNRWLTLQVGSVVRHAAPPRGADWRPRYPEVVSGPSPRHRVVPSARLSAPALIPSWRGLGGALRRRCVRRPGFRDSPAARACPAESSKATAVCKHPAAANRTRFADEGLD